MIINDGLSYLNIHFTLVIYNKEWIANMHLGCDTNKSVIKRLWCIQFEGIHDQFFKRLYQ